VSSAFLLFAALLLDAVLGEPRWLWDRVPHPAVVMGRIIAWCDTRLNTGQLRRFRGIGVVAALSTGALALGETLAAFGPPGEIVVVAILLAQRSLCDHVGAVADALRLSTGDGRLMVARIVSRDTSTVSDSDVARAAIESAAENLSDGVIAPAFWFLVGGLPGLILYKIVNTADSMIGYRTDRHADFGWAAARFDDLLNLIPARLTAAIIALLSGQLAQWSGIASDARRHKSPNAGWPEAAMARALDIALAGPRSYHGQKIEFAYVNPTGRKTLTHKDIEAAVTVLWKTWGMILAACFVIALI
jgi:adenosylcobinamide-phosphate synthase